MAFLITVLLLSGVSRTMAQPLPGGSLTHHNPEIRYSSGHSAGDEK
jgi:hypothetical protein